MKVLVTAASRHGATTEIADVIADILRMSDIDADVIAPDDVTSVEAYDAVVLGSGVYAGHWLQPAKDFVHRHREALVLRPVFLFSSGPLGDPPKPADEPDDAREMEETTFAMDQRVFAGRLTHDELSRPERLVTTVVRAPYGDFRPWDDIADWAHEIARYLAEEPVAIGEPT